MKKKCCRCNSTDISYNLLRNIWFCNNCNAIIYEFPQEDIDSSNTNTPLESSSDNNSK